MKLKKITILIISVGVAILSLLGLYAKKLHQRLYM